MSCIYCAVPTTVKSFESLASRYLRDNAEDVDHLADDAVATAAEEAVDDPTAVGADDGHPHGDDGGQESQDAPAVKVGRLLELRLQVERVEEEGHNEHDGQDHGAHEAKDQEGEQYLEVLHGGASRRNCRNESGGFFLVCAFSQIFLRSTNA